jgi:hypothetical protein
VSRGEGELLTAPKPRAVSLLSVCLLTVKPVGEPDALIGHVRFDERGWETERCRMAQATAPILDSTKTDLPMQSPHVRCWGNNGSRISVLRLVFRRRRLARARGKLEQRCSRALASLLALLADQPPGEVVDACRRHVAKRA